MNWKVIMRINVFFVSIVAVTLLLLTAASFSGDNWFFHQQALAQTGGTTTNNTGSGAADYGANATSPLLRGRVSFTVG
jgi:hypothetical protein